MITCCAQSILDLDEDLNNLKYYPQKNEKTNRYKRKQIKTKNNV
jgi:hypothetical protein